jgi:hypothetical protein
MPDDLDRSTRGLQDDHDLSAPERAAEAVARP